MTTLARWPEPLDLDEDAEAIAGRPELAFRAVVTVLRGVCPALSDDYLMCGPRGGTATTDWMRQCGMYLLAGRLGLNLVASGRLFRRDRSTVRHGVQVVLEAAARSEATTQFLGFLEAQLVDELRRMLFEGAE